MDNTQLIQRITKLEREIADLKNSNTIPLEIDKSFVGRGFLKSNSFYIGRTGTSVMGVARIPIPGATANSIAFATYAEFPDSGVIDSYIEFNTDHYELHIEALAGKAVNFIVFLNRDNSFNDLT